MREAYYGMMEKNAAKHQHFLKNRKAVEIARLQKGGKAFSAKENYMGEFLTITGDATSPKTEGWIDYDGDTLYIRFRCHEPDKDSVKRQVKPSENRAEVRNIFADDSVEIFIDVGRTMSSRYCQIAGNINGALWEAKWNRPEPPDREYRTGAEVKVTEAKDFWIIDFTIPLKSLKTDGPVVPGETWGFNLCRNRHRRKDKVRYRCWSPTFGSFHVVRRFGIVTFK